MPRIQPLEPENAPEQSRQLMEQGEQAMGQMLNFFKQMAVSPAAFQAYMNFEEALQGGSLDQLTREAVYLGRTAASRPKAEKVCRRQQFAAVDICHSLIMCRGL